MTYDLPYLFESINRNALVIHVKQPFIDWVQTIYPDYQSIGNEEGNIYLVRERMSNQDTEKWLKRNFDKFFCNELVEWTTDETKWPATRSFKLFKEWFSYGIYSMIFDLEKTPITKD